MVNFVVLLVLVLIVGGAGLYIYKAKEKGVKCIGCPAGANCPSCRHKDGAPCQGCGGSCGQSGAK